MCCKNGTASSTVMIDNDRVQLCRKPDAAVHLKRIQAVKASL
jgi:hypothetical protein